MTPQEARERVLKAVPEVTIEMEESFLDDCTLFSIMDGFHILACKPSLDEAWLSAANSDRVKQFYKEA